jgi:hypothetical protein
MGLAGFDGTSYEQQVGAAGIDQALAPPDTHVAAGATYLVEATNDAETIWTKTGTLVHTYDLNTLFPVPAQYQVNDPWVLYFGGRYYLSAWASDNRFNSQLYVAASAADDPTVWTTYLVKANTSSLVVCRRNNVVVCGDASHHRRGAAAHRFATQGTAARGDLVVARPSQGRPSTSTVVGRRRSRQ